MYYSNCVNYFNYLIRAKERGDSDGVVKDQRVLTQDLRNERTKLSLSTITLCKN